MPDLEKIANIRRAMDIGLCKVAYGPKDMRRVLKEVKKRQVRGIPELRERGYTATANKRQLRDVRRHFASDLETAGLPKPQAKLMGAETMPDTQLPPGVISAPPKGDAKRFLQAGKPTTQQVATAFKNDPMLKDMLEPESARAIAGDADRMQRALRQVKTPQQRMTLDALAKGHELAETQVKANPYSLAFGHLSPDVLMREHNMITTLPPHLKPAGNLARLMRQRSGEVDEMKGFGINFGVSPRLSRHARKRLLEAHKREMEPARIEATRSNLVAGGLIDG